MCLTYITQILRLFARYQNIFKQNKEGTFTGKLSIPFLESSYEVLIFLRVIQSRQIFFGIS